MKFEAGETYQTRSICDSNCIYSIEVLKRTAKTITVREWDKVKTLRVSIGYNGAEMVKPHGSYSMAAIIDATDAVQPTPAPISVRKLFESPVTKEELAAFKARRSAPAVIDPMQLPGMKAFHDSQFAGQLKIGRRHTVRVLSLEDASCVYQQLRDESGEGGSTFPDGELTIGNRIYRVSYNGKVWANMEWKSGDAPAYSPYDAVQS